jgi:single-strand DNA-binding protein
MFQRVQLIGRLGGDPILKYAQDGTPVTSFSMATSEKWAGKDGEQKERTTWWKVTVWRRQAETANQYLNKGSKVLVEGTMIVDENGGPKIWTDREGKPRSSYEIKANIVKFLDSRGSSNAPRDEDIPPESEF